MDLVLINDHLMFVHDMKNVKFWIRSIYDVTQYSAYYRSCKNLLPSRRENVYVILRHYSFIEMYFDIVDKNDFDIEHLLYVMERNCVSNCVCDIGMKSILKNCKPDALNNRELSDIICNFKRLLKRDDRVKCDVPLLITKKQMLHISGISESGRGYNNGWYL